MVGEANSSAVGPSRGWWLWVWSIPTVTLIAAALAMEYSSLDVLLLQPFYDPKGARIRV